MNLDRATNIAGWMSGPELQFLAKMAARSHKILEIGSYKGRSARALADNTDGTVTCIDPWDGKYTGSIKADATYLDYQARGPESIFAEFIQNLFDHIKSGKVHVYKEYFLDFETSEKFDFIFIDAIHEYEPVKCDITKALTLINVENGIIAGHDYAPNWPGVVKAVDELIPHRLITETIWHTRI